MLRRFPISGWPLFLYLLFSVIPANAMIVNKIVAIVNDEIITLTDLHIAGQDLLEKLSSVPEKERKQKEIETKSLVLDKLIEEKLIEQASKRLGLNATEKEVEDAIEDMIKLNKLNHEEFLIALSQMGINYDEYKKIMESEIIRTRFLERVIRSKVTVDDEELKEYYIKNQESFYIPSEVRLGQILLLIHEGASEEEKMNVRERAEKVLNMIKEGGTFEVLAVKFSEGPGADMKGDLGYIKKGEMNPDIEKVVFGLGIGEISGLIETDIGIHINKVLDIKKGAKKEFLEVKTEIENTLFQQKTEDIYQEWLEEMKARSYIDVKL